ncbi:hypothetical protein BGHDH14_bgh00492 [Blumeria hordei DH14]|uniref:Uncharacterized protein n=1 Tax=Blumeria graminis f. sp. hordei (strain DH14) TaxID=546991 RepID=N1JEU3_BLUG1|nr:hypothetical protein BGHDH14_bgh00492 [Blumeria hordei DH14]
MCARETEIRPWRSALKDLRVLIVYEPRSGGEKGPRILAARQIWPFDGRVSGSTSLGLSGPGQGRREFGCGAAGEDADPKGKRQRVTHDQACSPAVHMRRLADDADSDARCVWRRRLCCGAKKHAVGSPASDMRTVGVCRNEEVSGEITVTLTSVVVSKRLTHSVLVGVGNERRDHGYGAIVENLWARVDFHFAPNRLSPAQALWTRPDYRLLSYLGTYYEKDWVKNPASNTEGSSRGARSVVGQPFRYDKTSTAKQDEDKTGLTMTRCEASWFTESGSSGRLERIVGGSAAEHEIFRPIVEAARLFPPIRAMSPLSLELLPVYACRSPCHSRLADLCDDTRRVDLRLLGDLLAAVPRRFRATDTLPGEASDALRLLMLRGPLHFRGWPATIYLELKIRYGHGAVYENRSYGARRTPNAWLATFQVDRGPRRGWTAGPGPLLPRDLGSVIVVEDSDTSSVSPQGHGVHCTKSGLASKSKQGNRRRKSWRSGRKGLLAEAVASFKASAWLMAPRVRTRLAVSAALAMLDIKGRGAKVSLELEVRENSISISPPNAARQLIAIPSKETRSSLQDQLIHSLQCAPTAATDFATERVKDVKEIRNGLDGWISVE